ncbi:MAG: acyloxyacyl hydrolase [Endozoicomonas sp.]
MRKLYCVLFWVIITPAQALDLTPDGISLAYGEDIDTGVVMTDTRISLRWNWDHGFFQLQNWDATGYIDVSASFLKSNANPEKVLITHLPSSDKAEVYAVSPVFRFISTGYHDIQPFIDLGIGGAWFSDYHLEREGNTRQRLGGRGQFEIRAGGGILLGPEKNLELGYRIIHYSNASIHDINMGLNFHMLTLGYWFK